MPWLDERGSDPLIYGFFWISKIPPLFRVLKAQTVIEPSPIQIVFHLVCIAAIHRHNSQNALIFATLM
jgi:hypothetical protein